MSSPIDTFVAAGGTSGAPTAQNSRYYGLATTTWTQPDGTVVRYLQRRIIPQPDQYTTVRLYAVIQGDRIDTVANAQLGDPLLYWILCDANAAMDPELVDGRTRSRGAHHLARGDRGGGNDRQHRGQQWLAAFTSPCWSGRWCRCPRRSRSSMRSPRSR